ncbi:hypothetical protein ACIBP6_13130 [Nonomuraea terrae]|uniref:hypothetical protein n=1 Tax=Nonomuraea terrae TaxID=2530383 RepID=UPI003787D95A
MGTPAVVVEDAQDLRRAAVRPDDVRDHASTARYARSLRRIRSHLDDQVSADDPATLDTLIDSDGPVGVLRRDDLTVRTTRTAWLAERP